ncbi:ABC transporter substrate-binding protein [Aquipuribacter nitratireducens]|uniref:ABC transporter substrate-binding protein n=1 Tax=Aquipuribacter nitratireducens TaxID=650104 RepID=A0ABW0GIZ9_9MICO
MIPTRISRRAAAVTAALLAPVFALAACGDDAGSESGGDASDAAGSAEPVELSILIDDAENSLLLFEGLTEAYTEQNPNVTFSVETRPGGGEGDNIVKTRLATGDMTDLFFYNSGSLLAALNPSQTLVPVTDQPWVDNLNDAFVQAVSADEDVFGAPVGSNMAGGMFYNEAIYEELGLDVPTTWEEFMANNEVIAAETDAAPVVQTYQDTWTSQLFVLGDFHNVLADNPDWAEQYTANEVKYASDESAIQGFEHLQEVYDAGYLNEDFASATYPEGLEKIATGEGVHYPMLSFAVSELVANFPDQAEDVGFAALPGDDADSYGLTVWTPGGMYLPQSTEGAERDAALDFMGFVASPEACEVQTAAAQPTGPYAVEGCELPADVPNAVQDLQAYFDTEGQTSPALEFLSPIKGPALEQITVEVGSGIRSAEDGAALYDEDVEKQAQQLGIEGW